MAQSGAAAPDAGVVDLEKPVALSPLRWLPQGTDIAAALTNQPARVLHSEQHGGKLSLTAKLGELAFESPQIFGGLARKSGLSCQTCHTNGHVNVDFFVPGLSSRPGSFDASNALFAAADDDHRLNDVDIPSLRGVGMTAPYGRDGRFPSLREITRHVIVREFSGPEPAPWLLDALVAYQREFAFLPGAASGADLAAIAKGRALFERPFPGNSGLSCAACHPADALFTDRRPHDIGTGGLFDTPSLLNMMASAPYFHDGSAPDLAAVVAHFDEYYALGLSVTERRDMLAYLRSIGVAQGQPVAPGLADAVAGFQDRLALLGDPIEREDAERLDFVIRALRQSLQDIFERMPGPELAEQRSVLVDWSRALAAVGRAFSDAGDSAARRALQDLRSDVGQRGPLVSAAHEQSLYNPELLRARFTN